MPLSKKKGRGKKSRDVTINRMGVKFGKKSRATNVCSRRPKRKKTKKGRSRMGKRSLM